MCRLHALLFILLPAFSILGQDDFEQWLKKDQEAYQNYLSEQDRAFLNFLKEDWEAFKLAQGIKADPRPKPVRMPVAPPPAVKELEKPTEEPVKPEKKIATPPSIPPAPVAPPKRPSEILPEKPHIDLNFFEKSVMINFDPNLELQIVRPLNNQCFAAAWERMAKSDYQAAVQQLEHHAQQMQLNDWGTLLLLHTFSRQIKPQNSNEPLIIDWFLLNKMGYNAKIAYQEDRVFLLIPTAQTMYETPFTEINGQKYYFIGFNNAFRKDKVLFTYPGSYESAENLNLSLPHMPVIREKKEHKPMRFAYNGKDYAFDIDYARDAVDFMADYPQTDLQVYLQTSPSPELLQSLFNSLSPCITGMSEREAINFLLRFVQTAFHYQTDDQQFGREKYLSPEETIYYPSSDCEDRSILFALLVKRLTGLPVIVLDYPGHVATAVLFRDQVAGDFIAYRGKRYVVCDPTFINASAGMCMDAYKTVNPKIIDYY